MPLQSRALKAFIVLAEELHFGRAAQRLHMTQPPLSQLIRKFEATLGVPLFVRHTRAVRLTASGRLLFDWARRQRVDTAGVLRQVRQLAQEQAGSLALGFSSSVAYRVLPRLLAHLHATRPGLAITLHESHSERLVVQVKEARLDFALLRRPAALNEPDLLFHLQGVEDFLLALPAAHALARDERVEPARLHGLRYIGYSEDTARYFRERAHSLFAHYQIQPDVVHESAMPVLLPLVQAGLGVALVPDSAIELSPPGVVYRRLADPAGLAFVELYSVRRRSDDNPAVALCQQLLDALESGGALAAAGQGRGGPDGAGRHFG